MPSRRLDPGSGHSQAGLDRYRDKRSAATTPEPFGGLRIPKTGKLFVVQQHAARHLHWDLRLEVDGVLKSWAVPKGPSSNPADKRFAALVEDHPLDYADFEGQIPAGNYGAGQVIVWDRGTWLPLNDFNTGLKQGKLLFQLKGYKLNGRWTLVRIRDRGKADDDGSSWLFIKEHDQWASDEPTPYADDSVLSGLTLKELDNPRAKATGLRRAVMKAVNTEPLAGAVATKPMLAKAGAIFDHSDWLFELKYDGYRLLAVKTDGAVRLISRNGHHLTQHFPEIAACLERLPDDQFVIDGEIVANDEQGVPSFSLLQQRARLSGELDVARAAIELPSTYYAFDALQIDSYDLRPLPLEKRKQLLKRLLPTSGPLRYSEHIVGRGKATFDAAAKLGLEGVVAKRRRSSYQAGRSDAWIKVRSKRTGDFVIVGWLANRNNAEDLGALALGEFRESGLTYVGRVGSGLSAEIRRDLLPRLQKLPKAAGLITDHKGPKQVHWVAPRLVCEVGYKEYTREGQLRQPAFKRLRDDKSAEECLGKFDDPSGRTLIAAPEPEVTITHHDKIFYPELNLTKGDLVRYYERIAPWMLPYLRDRPIVLTRYPDGIHGKSFYQRDAPDFVPDWIQREVLWSEGAEREVRYFIVQSAAALKYLANLGTIPIHVWHSRITDMEHPDWCVLDLDPKQAPFKDVVKLALGIGELADEIELPAYPKTSGASGLHVLIPLGSQLTHDQAKTLGELIARVIVKRFPGIATIARNIASRHEKVYVDYLQNGRGRLIAAPFSARAEPSAGASMPLKWGEVNARLSNARFHIKNAPTRLKRLKTDPLAAIWDDRVDLARALSHLADIMARD